MLHQTFGAWRVAVNREIEKQSGLSIMDLPDQNYHDMFDDEMEPEEAAKEALNASDFPMALTF